MSAVLPLGPKIKILSDSIRVTIRPHSTLQFRSDCYPQKVNGLVAAFLILVEHSLDLDRTLDTFEGIPTNSSKDCCVASNIVTSDVSIFQVLVFKKS